MRSVSDDDMVVSVLMMFVRWPAKERGGGRVVWFVKGPGRGPDRAVGLARSVMRASD
jgi:hypothetical protein